MSKKCIVSYKNPIRSSWDAVPMLLSVYNALIIPFEFSFALPYEFLKINQQIDICLDILFLIDNLLMFFTSFQSKYGYEVFDFHEIFIAYTHTWRFVFDTLSLFGMYFFKTIHRNFKYFQLFKATRVSRISRLIQKSNQPI